MLYGGQFSRNHAKTLDRIRYKFLHLRWRQAEKLRNLCFRRTDDQSQHECRAGEIRQATNRTRPKTLVLIFFFARVRQHSNRLSDENVSSLTVSECWNRRFKCSHIELCHRTCECVFDELAVCYEIPNQRCEFIQMLEQQEAPRCALR